MLFHSLLFIYFFLPATLILYYYGSKGLRNIVLLTASILFSAWFQIYLTLVLIGSVTFNYFAAIWIERAGIDAKRKLLFILALVFNLALLGIFKYLVFLNETLADLFSFTGMNIFIIKEIAVPIGISFYTFKGMSYLISVKRKEINAERKYLNFALYISIFPELVAGPIDRYATLGPQLASPSCSAERFASGIRRFVIGLGKKVIIATPLALVADRIFGSPVNDLNAATAWLGAICYMLQIYYDFSGYTDMAIGIGKMFGLEFSENFNLPYTARSFRDFWKRWHITLSTWLRDYLFLPLAYSYSRRMAKERYFNIRTDKWIFLRATLITFLLCGLWHGAAWSFILWGLFHGIMLVLEQFGLGKILKKSYKPVQHFYLLFFILLSWIFFRSPSARDALNFIGAMFGAGGRPEDFSIVTEYLNRNVILVLCLAILGASPFFERALHLARSSMNSSMIVRRVAGTHLYYLSGIILVVVIFVLSTIFMVARTSVPFIYFKF